MKRMMVWLEHGELHASINLIFILLTAIIRYENRYVNFHFRRLE